MKLSMFNEKKNRKIQTIFDTEKWLSKSKVQCLAAYSCALGKFSIFFVVFKTSTS